MTFDEFKGLVALNRGQFKRDFDTEFTAIYKYADEDLLHEATEKKHLGIAKIAQIATALDPVEQREFVEWLNADKRNATQVTEKFLTY